ncbi:MAG TPA: hypothetical protein VKV04_07710 [Verrucomicrobiae bacterium]|nr:hypothetical protein [Verrucomicrobiae bacterium]
MTDSFKLDSGRVVNIETVSIESTFGNFADGHPAALSEIVWKSTPNELEPRYGNALSILKPDTATLPNYRFVVALRSSPLPDEQQWRPPGLSDKPLRTIEWDFSLLAVCWFQDALGGSLVEEIRRAVKNLEWEKHAKNSKF